jgi:hypothetical protein
LARRREKTGRVRLAGVLFAPVDYGSYSGCINVHERPCCLGIPSWPSLHSSQRPTPETKLRSKAQKKITPPRTKTHPGCVMFLLPSPTISLTVSAASSNVANSHAHSWGELVYKTRHPLGANRTLPADRLNNTHFSVFETLKQSPRWVTGLRICLRLSTTRLSTRTRYTRPSRFLPSLSSLLRFPRSASRLLLPLSIPRPWRSLPRFPISLPMCTLPRPPPPTLRLPKH